MASQALENLVKIGTLHASSHSSVELEVLLKKSRAMLDDAKATSLSLHSRFILAYGAAHGLALAALWASGYRSENRYTVFDCLIHTTQLPYGSRRVLLNAHRARNQMEYEAEDHADGTLVAGVIAASEELALLLNA